MKKIFFILLGTIVAISCKKTDTDLNFQQFKNTKWIVGEVGLNGEKPDTIIFDKPETLTYISTDTGKEICKYSFSKDTLIFTSYTYESSLDSDDIKCEYVNRLLYRNNTYKYCYYDEKCTGDNRFKRIQMDAMSVVFRKI